MGQMVATTFGYMCKTEARLIGMVAKEEAMDAKMSADELAERDRVKALYHSNKLAGFHATVYVDPDNNMRRKANHDISVIMPTTKCAAHDGDPIMNVFRGAHLIESLKSYKHGDLELYEK